MLNLEQKHHGVAARGILGIDGSAGAKGISVYIGFINDFFDYAECNIDPAIRYTKRKTSVLNNTTAWSNYKALYNTMDINNMYYTGEFTNIKTIGAELPMDVVNYNDRLPGEAILLNPPGNSNTEFSENSTPTDIEHYEFLFVQDVKYTTGTNEELSYVDVYDFLDPLDPSVLEIDHLPKVAEEIAKFYDPVPAYTVHIDIKHITYDYSDLKRIALLKFKALHEKYPDKYTYDMWDFFTTHDDDGNQITGKQSPETYQTWLDDPDKYPLFVREKLEGKFAEYRTGVTSYFGMPYIAYDRYNKQYSGYKTWSPDADANGLHYLIMPDDDRPAIEDLTYALTYFKQPVKTYPLYSYGSEHPETDVMVDYEGFIYIGIDDNTMYKVTDDGEIIMQKPNDILNNIRKTDDDKPLMDLTDFTLSDPAPYINAIRDYTITLTNNSSKDLLPKSDLVVWHSGTGKLKLPTTLASTINVGDIIYFYTNKGLFNSVNNADTQNTIEYMAVITEDMIGCTVQELVDKAQVIKPFNYSAFNDEYSEERAEINRSAIITSIYRNLPSDYDDQGFEHFNIKSIEEILTLKDSGCALRIISGNYLDNMSSAPILNFITKNNSTFNKKKTYSNFQIDSIKNNTVWYDRPINRIKTDKNTGILAILNLAVNKTILKPNFELTDIVYDRNLKFIDGHFLYDAINSGNIDYEISTNISNNINTYTFSYIINKFDLLSNKGYNYAYDYMIGYHIIDDKTGLIIKTEMVNDNTITMSLNLSQINESLECFSAEIPGITGDSTVDSSVNEQIETPKQYYYWKLYTIIVMLKNKTGMCYYTNPTLLFVYIDPVLWSSKTQPLLQVIGYDVKTLYPYKSIEDEGEINEEGNIVFNVPELTPEDYTGKVHLPITFSISTLADNINIKNITFNGQPITKKIINNSWATIEDKGNYTYTLKLQDNIPDITGDINNRNNTKTIHDYMISYCNKENDYYNTCELFEYLKNKVYQPKTLDRNIKICVTYTIDDKEETQKEYYTIVLPGFTDPRQLPKFNISLVNTFTELEEINTIKNGVLCNLFKTNLNIKLDKDIANAWLKYNNDVTIDLTISQINKNYEGNKTVDMPTLLLMPSTSSVFDGNTKNYYKFEYTLDDEKYNDYFIFDDVANIDYITNKNLKITKFKALTITLNNKSYHIINSDLHGHHIYLTNKIIIKDIPLQYIMDDNGINVGINFEFSNPIISQLFLQYAITNCCIHYKVDENDYAFNIKETDDYIFNIQKEKYNCITDSLKMEIHPFSLIADTTNPAKTNANVVDLNVVKIQTNDDSPITTQLKLYGKGIYDQGYFVYPKAFMYNDDIQSIKTETLLAADNIEVLKNEPYYSILDIDGIKSTLNLHDLNSKKYLSVFYDADIFHPRYRDGVETFYLNNKTYPADKYRQYSPNNGILAPALFNVDGEWQIRTDEEMEAIDTWNYEFKVQYEAKKNDFNILKKWEYLLNILGKKSTYGFGWYLYTKKHNLDKTNPYEEDGIMHVTELYNRSTSAGCLQKSIDVSTATTPLESTMSNSSKFPDSNGLFRILAREMKWEYVYEYNNEYKHALFATPFDCLIAYAMQNNIGLDIMQNSFYITHYTKLKQLSGDNYIPYNLCYNLSNRFAQDIETGWLHYHMLRKPAISQDNEYLSDDYKKTKYLEGYSLKLLLNLNNVDLSDTANNYTGTDFYA